MKKKQPSIPILELSNFEPETKQENTCNPASQIGNGQSQSVAKNTISATLRAVLSQFISRENKNAVASIITLVGISGFLLIKFLPSSAEQDLSQNLSMVKGEITTQQETSGSLADLIQKHAKEKSALFEKQNEMILKIKTESDKKIARERAAIASEQEKQAKLIQKEMKERLSKQRNRMLLEQKRLAEQLEKEMHSKLVAQQKENTNSEIQPKDQIDQLANESQKVSEVNEGSLTNVVETKAEISADLNKKENDPLFAAQEAESIVKQKAIKERAQREIQERLEKQQIIFLAELDKLARQQKEEIQSLKDPTKIQASNIQIPSEDPAITKLFNRIEKGNITYLQKFLKQGGNPNQFNHHGQSLLTKAAFHDQYIMATELLRAGAKVDLPDNFGMNPLIYGSSYGNTGIVELLVSNGANVNYLSPNSESALIYASKNSHLEIVDLLLRAGANVNARNSQGRTALFFATKNNDNATTTLLLENGANQTSALPKGARVFNSAVGNNIALN